MQASAHNVFEVLRYVGASNEPLGVADVSRALGLSSSTTHRALITLEATGYLARVPHSARFRPGPGVDRLIRGVFEKFPLRKVGLAYLRALAQTLDGAASLTCRLGWYGLRLITVDGGTDAMISANRMGELRPLHETASGRTILALLDEADRARYGRWVAGQGDAAPAVDASARGSDRIRADGFDTDGGTVAGFQSLVFPVCGPDGVTLGVAAVEAPAGRPPLEQTPALSDCLRIVTALEAEIARVPALQRRPFEHLDPDHVTFSTSPLRRAG